MRRGRRAVLQFGAVAFASGLLARCGGTADGSVELERTLRISLGKRGLGASIGPELTRPVVFRRVPEAHGDVAGPVA